VAVIGYTAWRERFGGAPDILGRTLRLNSTGEVTVIGVAPPGFKGVTALMGPDLWMPAAMIDTLVPGRRNLLRDRTQPAFNIAARLKPGVSSRQAAANVQTIAASLKRQYPELPQDQTVVTLPLAKAALGDIAQPLLYGSIGLMTIVGLVLLISCSNAASLFLARASGRRQEIAVRLAMGATRARLVRQLLTECLVLALAGGAVGLAMGWQGCRLLWSLRPAEVALNFVDPKLDGGVVVFALLASLGTAVIFGLAPAIQSSRPEIINAIKEEARTTGRTRSRVTFRNLLLVAQVAFSLVALITSALFLRSMQRAYTIDPGYQTAHLGIFMTNPGQAGYDRTRAESFYREARERVGTMPGIASATWASAMPLWNTPTRTLQVDGQEQVRKQDAVPVIVNSIDLGYFETFGVPLLSGRGFSGADAQSTAAVAIVNKAFADRYWPRQDPIGRRFHFYGDTSPVQVVGMAGNANYTSLGETPQPCVFLPLRQSFSMGMILYVRTKAPPATVLTAVQRELLALEPKLDVNDARTGDRLIEQALFAPRIGVGLLSVFGLLGLGLASVGLYGIIAYSMGQRRREIGVRVALGASQAMVLRMVIRQGMTLVAAGIVVGAGLALLVARGLSRLLYGVSAADPISFVTPSLVLAGIAFVACYLPARRVSRLDPLEALRES